MRSTFIAILLVAAFLIGGGIIATVAYQAGLSTAVTTAVAESGATVVTPVAPVVPAYGWGWGWGGPGFGIFGFLAFLFFLFLVIGIIRFAFFAGRGPRGGPWGWDHRHGEGYGPGRWEGRAGTWFDEQHRRAHDQGSVASSPDAGRPEAGRPDAGPAA
jgi:hypothetical protein